MTPPLSVADTVTVLRRRYPDALVCVECGLLLATQRESYAKSDLTEVQRHEYVCAECKLEAAEAERIRALKVAQAAVARKVAAEARRAAPDLYILAAAAPYGRFECCGEPRSAPRASDINPAPGGDDCLPSPILETPKPASKTSHKQRGFEAPTEGFISPESRNKGGRPRKHSSALVARREAQRAYRARQREATHV
jgi:hypothetical protein